MEIIVFPNVRERNLPTEPLHGKGDVTLEQAKEWAAHLHVEHLFYIESSRTAYVPVEEIKRHD